MTDVEGWVTSLKESKARSPQAETSRDKRDYHFGSGTCSGIAPPGCIMLYLSKYVPY
jgi:hypothetical protein